MKVGSADGQQGIQEKVVSQPQKRENHFSRLMARHFSEPHLKVDPLADPVKKSDIPASQNTNLVHLGTVTDRVSTVSNLLVRHPVYRKDTWRIIQSDQNKDKPYTDIRPGTDIYLDPETMEISWNRIKNGSGTTKRIEPPVSKTNFESQAKNDEVAAKPTEFIELGMISRNHPTVSHILKQNPDYRQTAYAIIHSEINQDKPYTRMVEGTRVYLNPESLEIVWDNVNSRQDAPAIAQDQKQPDAGDQPVASSKPDLFSENLVKSVEHFVGSPYEEIDCFELLVRGLDKMGIKYDGRGGLYNQLVKMATAKGLPENAYLNGEGLIEASGTQVYYKSMPRINNAKAQADRIYKEMEPFLNKGFVLSFSTQTRGHTGIVSQKDQMWTYINSGTMDHHLGGNQDPKGVGEEVLAEEIKNWVTLAAKSKQPLKITLGKLNEQKLLGV